MSISGVCLFPKLYDVLILPFESIDFINPETINDLIELVKNHIQSMKLENKDAEFLPVIEEYYNNTIYLMSQGKKEGKNKILSSLSIP